jgi:hypothetical protein
VRNNMTMLTAALQVAATPNVSTRIAEPYSQVVGRS